MPFDIRRYKSVDSTNTVLKDLIQPYTREGLVVVASEQTQGRGRLGRPWISHKGNLYASLLLLPQANPKEVACLTYMASLAVARMCEELLPATVPIRIKWPNDVLINDAKVSGILLETMHIPSIEQMGVIIGIGLNIAADPCLTDRPTTSLNAWTSQPLFVGRVLTALLRQISESYMSWKRNGFSEIRKKWQERSLPLGSPIEVKDGPRLISGQYQGITEEGALLLQDQFLRVHRLYAGELHDIVY